MTWGERNSDVLCSPADVSRLVKKIDQHANEDDILHADDQDLENFGGTLSTEEASAPLHAVGNPALSACSFCPPAWSALPGLPAGLACCLPHPPPVVQKVDSCF